MNALKVFVIVIGMLFFAATASVASAAMATTLTFTGNSVGSNGVIYFAGAIEFADSDGNTMMGMTIEPTFGSLNLSYQNPFPVVISSYTDLLLSGVNPGYTLDQYSKGAQIFTQGLLGVYGNPQDNVWAGCFNEMMWKALWGDTGLWDSCSQPDSLQNNTVLGSLYPSVSQSLVSGFDPGDSIKFAISPTGAVPPMILYANPVPVPPALWLFGSGLLGLAGIARRKVFRA